MMYTVTKRGVDVILALVLLVLLSPFFLLLFIILLATGEHRIFYLQKRMGYKNQPFFIYKFATMLQNSPSMGTGTITIKNDPRVLPVGRFLRISKINELPQLINVLNGSMSFVGPRPQIESDLKKFSNEAIEKMYLSRPGITGIGSVIFRDEEKWISACNGDKHEFYKNAIAPYKGELELWYNQHKSMYVDMLLMFSTVCVIFFPKSRILEKCLPGMPTRPAHLQPV